ncbi:MAG: septation regulator SpoVG [Acidobacteriota bacterium]
MEITDVRVFPVNQDKLRAFVSIVLDDCFVIGDIKIINGNNGLFISMPSKRRKDGTFRDIAHPLNSETRQMLEERVIQCYRDMVAGEEQARPLETPRLEGAEPLGDVYQT